MSRKVANSEALLTNQHGEENRVNFRQTIILRLNPKFSVEVHKQKEPIKDPTVLERHITALRKAGLK